MAPPRTPSPPLPEIIASARQDYLDGRRVEDICGDYELTQSTLYPWLDGGPASAPQRLPPLPRRTGSKTNQPQRVSGSRHAVVKRLWRTAARQARDVETRLITGGQTPAERESDARLVAVLVKTLAELGVLEEGKQEPRGKHGAHSPKAAEHDHSGDDETGPVAIEDLRRELASRLAALAEEEAPGTAGEPDAAAT